MDNEYIWYSDIQKLYRMEGKKGKKEMFAAEERREIPPARLMKKGRHMVRHWKRVELPAIGEKLGFLKKPKKQEILCIYTAKGGVLKTTLSYNLARILALNGIKTLVIGLDIQCSITDITLPPVEFDSLEEAQVDLGLYNYIYSKESLLSIVKPTDLPTLSIIPETFDLNLLAKKIYTETRRECIFKDRLIPFLKDYEVIIFDNGPSWNQLIENSLTAATNVICPIGCDFGTYQALQTNLESIIEFKSAMNLSWDNLFLVPTLLEKTKLSQQVYGTYLNQYADYILSLPIRRAIKGQEAIAKQQSAIEYDPSSTLAQDYFELLQEIWKRVLRA